MAHNSQQGIYLGQELLLDYAAWIDLTSNADYSLISFEFEVTEHMMIMEFMPIQNLLVMIQLFLLVASY